jgi:threonine aldolase
MSDHNYSDCTVHFRSDGLALSPGEYSNLLARIAADRGIAADEFSRDGVVAELEDRMAALLGKETAIFLPSGTLANHLALRLLAKRGRRILVQRESHIYNDSGDCVQELSGLTLIPLAPGRATFRLAEVEDEVARAEEGRVSTPVGIISIECPVRRIRGEVFDFGEIQRIAAFARERRIGLHLDGARIFLAPAYTGISADTYAKLFDTVYVSLYKYFNAAGGAVLAGPKHLLDNLYHQRRMFGGSLRQAWPLAAVALHISTGSTSASGAPRQLVMRCFKPSHSNPDARSYAPRPLPMSPACGFRADVLRPSPNGCRRAASRSARRPGLRMNRPSSSCSRTRRFCGAR